MGGHVRGVGIGVVGIVVSSLAPGGISALSAEKPDDAATASVADIVVSGRVRRLYRIEETTVGKVPAKPLDMPQSVQVVNADMIADRGARDITDLYRDIPGLSANNYATVTFRGFRQDVVYYDGLRGDPFQTFSVPQLFTIDRVEFLKGPSGMLYGASAPGGAINYVTKKPSERFAATVRAIAGNYRRYGGSADVTGPLTKDGGIAGRAGLFYETLDSVRVHAGSRTLIADGGLRFRLDDDTTLTVQLTDYDQNLPGNRLRGIAVDANGNFLTYRAWNHNEPGDFIRYNGLVGQARLDTRLSDAVSFNVAARRFRYREHQEYHEPVALRDTDRDGVADAVTREFRWQKRAVDGTSAGANLIARARALGIAHTVLVGADWYGEDSRSRLRATRAVPVLSLRDPVYGTTAADRYDLSTLPVTRADTRAERYGLYMQDQLGIGRHFILVAGARRDWFADRDRVAGTRADGAATTSRLGAIWKPWRDVSLYVSWADTFEPQDVASQTGQAGGPFAPVTGDQIEAGIKTDLLDGRVQTTLAAYRIVRRNTLLVDPDIPAVNGVDQLSPIGEVTSKGVETTATVDLTANWLVQANYAYNDTRITGGVPGQSIDNSVGDRFPNAPRHQGGIWTRLQFPGLQGAVALGAQHVSHQLDRSGDRLKPFTIFDTSVTRSFGAFDVMLRLENIFDRYYAVSGFTGAKGAYVGKPRTFFVELRRQF